MDFAQILEKKRKEKGYTAKEFSQLVGVPYTTYHSYERGATVPKYDTLCKIADLLKVSLDDLLGRKNMEYLKAAAFFRAARWKVTTAPEGRVICSPPDREKYEKSEDMPGIPIDYMPVSFPSVGAFYEFYIATVQALQSGPKWEKAVSDSLDSYLWKNQVKPLIDDFIEKSPLNTGATEEEKKKDRDNFETLLSSHHIQGATWVKAYGYYLKKRESMALGFFMM